MSRQTPTARPRRRSNRSNRDGHQAIFFDLWRQEHADADLEPIPADMVMASPRTDPHHAQNANITRPSLPSVPPTRTGEPAQVRKEIEAIEQALSAGALVGVDLVNVLEVTWLDKPPPVGWI